MKSIIAAALLALSATAATAQDRVGDLERKVDALTREIETLKMGSAAEEPTASKPEKGYAPAASKVYRGIANRVSIGGYGEFIYSNPSRVDQKGDVSGTRPTADATRAVLYVGYKFTDRILFNSEYEFEHATTGEGGETRGEVSVEQAYLDFKVVDPFNVRAGLVLLPLGLTNEMHEPTTFHGAFRPTVEQVIIPTTWRENGVGFFGEWGPLSYRTYVLAGLHAKSTTDPDTGGFTAAEPLREGRTGGSSTLAEDKAWAGRLDFTPMAGTMVGGSVYIGEADHNLETLPSIPVTLWDVHARGEWRGAELKGLYAEGYIGNADQLSAVQGETIGRKFFGGYVEGAFNVLSLCRKTSQYVAPFFRYERLDTQWRTPDALAKDPANSRVEYTVGLTYKPIPQVAVKLDQQWLQNQARTGVNRWNLGLAYIF